MAEHQSVSVEDLKDIQAGPLANVPTRATVFAFFFINNVNEFRTLFGRHVLRYITSSDVARGIRRDVFRAKALHEMTTLAGINVSFSQQGLRQLSDADTNDPAFAQGQRQRAESLGDNIGNWLPEFKDNPIHGLFEVTGYPKAHVESVADDVIRNLSASITVRLKHIGEARPGNQKGHEHFGFNDGISEPYVKFRDDDQQQPRREPLPGQTVVNPGVLVLGQPGDAVTRPSWAKNGSFVVYRHLKQLVPEFNKFLKDAVSQNIIIPATPSLTDTEEFNNRVDFLGARLMGRWKSGLPVVLTAKVPGRFPVDDPARGKNPRLNNVFDYGPRSETPRRQFLCPFAAHARKTGPRTDIPQENVEKRAIRRGGITYGREVQPEEMDRTVHERGLSFVCYQSSVEDGFEFTQKTWSNNEDFPRDTGGVRPGFDPIIGQRNGEARSMTGYDAEDLTKSLRLPTEFIIAQGGEYFFLPSLTTLKRITETTT